MELYDKVLKECMELLEGRTGRLVYEGNSKKDEEILWQDAGDNNLVLRSEMAYELGGNGKEAVSGLGFTTSREIAGDDEVWLYGPELSEIQEDTSYARLAFIRLKEKTFEDSNTAYGILRKIEYTRYHMNPEGYMMRISAASEREPVRVSKAALEEGISFGKVGELFIQGYHRHQQVEAVKLIYITASDFPYEKLHEAIRKMEKITESLNHILLDLKMDCTVCNLKPVCDEVEGMRKLHFEVEEKRNT